MNKEGPVSLLSEGAAISDRDRGDRIGILDVGSNSLRLVIYEGSGRAWFQMFNERGTAGLGASLQSTGKLDDDAIESAVASLRRFTAVAEEMGVAQLVCFATAAVRDATNGKEFVKLVKRELDLDIKVLSGQDEAKLAALGVVSGMPKATGLVGDLGGGSLELVQVEDGETGKYATLPVGVLRFDDVEHLDRAQVNADLKRIISDVDWLKSMKGEALYLVGGSWRSLAKLHIDQSRYPLEILHDYEVSVSEFVDFLSLVSKMSRAQLDALHGVSSRRVKALPVAALVLRRVIKSVNPSRIIFSSYGVREGALFDQLPKAARKLDPLLEGCAHLAHRYSRFTPNPDILTSWIEPLVGIGSESRIVQAVCLLSDLGWIEHPSYRAEHAFIRALRLPVAGMNHSERVFIALALLARYQGRLKSKTADNVRSLLAVSKQHEALELGLALRLAHTLSAGSTRLLAMAKLRVDEKLVALKLEKPVHALQSEAVRKRLSDLAKARGLEHKVVLIDEPNPSGKY